MTITDELTKLATLRDSGALTDDEFTTEKTRLLADFSEYLGDEPDDDELDRVQLPMHSGAFLVTTIFKLASVLVAVVGVISGIVAAVTLNHHQVPGANTVGIVIGIILGSLVTAAVLAFFAYVVDLLVQIDWNTRGLRFWDPEE